MSDAGDILSRAEADLAELAAVAAGRQDYAEAARLLGLAEDVRRLRYGFASDPEGATRASASSVAGSPATQSQHELDGNRSGGQARGAPKVYAYPKFRRDGDEIIKIGRGKSAGRTYEHRSPVSVLRRLCRVALATADARYRFSTEQLFPLRDEDDQELPSYQGYLCLAWLRRTGLVRVDGRAKYSIPKGAAFLQAVEEALAEVPAG